MQRDDLNLFSVRIIGGKTVKVGTDKWQFAEEDLFLGEIMTEPELLQGFSGGDVAPVAGRNIASYLWSGDLFKDSSPFSQSDRDCLEPLAFKLIETFDGSSFVVVSSLYDKSCHVFFP